MKGYRREQENSILWQWSNGCYCLLKKNKIFCIFEIFSPPLGLIRCSEGMVCVKRKSNLSNTNANNNSYRSIRRPLSTQYIEPLIKNSHPYFALVPLYGLLWKKLTMSLYSSRRAPFTDGIERPSVHSFNFSSDEKRNPFITRGRVCVIVDASWPRQNYLRMYCKIYRFLAFQLPFPQKNSSNCLTANILSFEFDGRIII